MPSVHEPQLAIVVVNYRTPDLVIEGLGALMAPGGMPAKTQVIVADCASGDGSVNKIATAIHEQGWEQSITMLPLEANGGFSFGNNRGIAQNFAHWGRSDYVLLLNPDTVVRPYAVERLVDFMEARPEAGIAGSALEHSDGTSQACAFRFPTIAAELESEARLGPVSRLLKRWRVVADTAEEPSQVDWVSGASMILRTRMLEAIGMLDEEYFLYYEEVDLCRRAYDAGWSCWHVPQSRVVHLVGQSTGFNSAGSSLKRRPGYWFASRRRYFRKHHGLVYAFAADLAWVVGHLACRLRRRLEGRNDGRVPHLLQDFIRHSTIG